jgi:hypothetical protein
MEKEAFQEVLLPDFSDEKPCDDHIEQGPILVALKECLSFCVCYAYEETPFDYVANEGKWI